MTFLLLAIFANLWIYRILVLNFFAGILVLLGLWLLYKYQENLDRKIPIPLVLAMVLLLFFQVRTTQKTSLTAISNDDRRVIDMRLRAYPSRFLRVGYWLEERKESIAFWRITQNLFENLDPNLYFFANHPRQRVGIREFEKFPYLLLPVFVLGLLGFSSKKYLNFWLIFFFIPLLILAFVGNQNSLGPFSLFPFFVIVISRGLKKIKPNFWKIAIFLLVLIQIISYEIA